MRDETVSVLIPTFNRSDWLIESLNSILAQSRPADEIIVIVDGSTDKTLDILELYGSRIRILTQENSGKSVALNNAMAVATGSLIWVFDDDDIAEPDALAVLLGLLAENPQAGFAYGRHDRFMSQSDGSSVWTPTGYWRTCLPADFLFEAMLDMFAHQAGMLVRKSLYRRVGSFDGRFIRSQDYEMQVRLALHSQPVATDRVLFHQRLHDQPRGGLKSRIEAGSRERAWQHFDRMIFRNLYSSLPLSAYLPAGSNPLGPVSTRRALIRRGIVMARKNLWVKAGADLQRAAGILDTSLVPEEVADLRKIFMTKFDCDEVILDPETRHILLGVRRTSSVGAQISRVVARALLWRVRRAFQCGDFLLAFRFAWLAIGLSVPVLRDASDTSELAQTSLRKRR